jgi:hypothetical protein
MIREGSKTMNAGIPARLNSLGFGLLFERGIQVSVCVNLLRERIRVPAAADYLRSPREQ